MVDIAEYVFGLAAIIVAIIIALYERRKNASLAGKVDNLSKQIGRLTEELTDQRFPPRDARTRKKAGRSSAKAVDRGGPPAPSGLNLTEVPLQQESHDEVIPFAAGVGAQPWVRLARRLSSVIFLLMLLPALGSWVLVHWFPFGWIGIQAAIYLDSSLSWLGSMITWWSSWGVLVDVLALAVVLTLDHCTRAWQRFVLVHPLRAYVSDGGAFLEYRDEVNIAPGFRLTVERHPTTIGLSVVLALSLAYFGLLSAEQWPQFNLIATSIAMVVVGIPGSLFVATLIIADARESLRRDVAALDAHERLLIGLKNRAVGGPELPRCTSVRRD